MSDHERNQQGIVSFVTVLFVSIILTLMVLAFIRVMLNEQRQASDYDLSSRAYYPAESGFEDAILAIKQSIISGVPLTNPDTCDAEPSFDPVLDSSLEIEYTCQIISRGGRILFNSLDEAEEMVVDLSTTSGFNRVQISWHRSGVDGDGEVFTGTNDAVPGQNLRRAKWIDGNYNFPALMRAGITDYPQTPPPPAGTYSDSDFKHRTFFFYPDRRVPTPSTYDISTSPGTSRNSQARLEKGGCEVSFEYVCSVMLTGFDPDLPGAANDYVLRLRPLYRDTTVIIELFNDAVPVIADSQGFLIDVTGKAGPLFRRIFANVGVSLRDLSAAYVLYSEQDICKVFEVTRSQNRVSAGGNVACIP